MNVRVVFEIRSTGSWGTTARKVCLPCWHAASVKVLRFFFCPGRDRQAREGDAFFFGGLDLTVEEEQETGQLLWSFVWCRLCDGRCMIQISMCSTSARQGFVSGFTTACLARPLSTQRERSGGWNHWRSRNTQVERACRGCDESCGSRPGDCSGASAASKEALW